MPISDEIIELAPIKKSKSKMIILFVIMGVFFAAAAAFLVLYLLKPSATVSTGAVLSVEESPVNPSAVEGAKPLFQKSGSGNSPEYYATVGVQYTVAVKVSTEGEVNNQVSWVIEPSGAVERIREGSYEYGVTTVEDGAQSVHYLTFSVFPENAGEKITITARSQSDSTLRSVIEFNAVCQGAESISFTTMQRNVSGATVSNVTSDNITLPYYETSTNSYLFGYQQLGAFNGTDYADIAEVRKPDGTYTNKVAIESSNTSVAEVRVVETATRPIVEINLRKAGDTNITIKANVNNDSAEEVTKTIRLTVKNSKELGYIDDIRIIKEVTSKEYFASLKTMPASITSITLPYGSSFNDILSHIVLSPTTLQYDATGNKLIDSWKDSIEITSSDRSIVSVSTANGVVSLNAGSTLSSDCTLTIRDKSPNGLGTSRQLKVNVVGQNRANGIETAVTIGGESYIDSYVARNNLPISQGLSADINVTYIVSAPATTSAATLNKFISSAYRLEFNKSEISVKLSGTALEPYNPNPEAGQKSNEYDITNDLEFAKEGNTTTFKATVKFVVTIMDEAENGVVSFSFIKVGTELPNADNINLLDATVTKTVNFQVTNIARNVMLKTADIPGVEESALDIITAGGTKPGKIVEVSPPTQTGDRWTLKYNVYIQYDNQNAPLWFKPQDLIYVDGPANMTGPTYSDYRSGSLALTSDGDLMFSSYLKTDRSSANASIKYTNSSGATIGDVTIVIFVINGVDRIVVGDSSVATVKYSGSGSEKASFSVDKVTYQHIYGSSTSDSNEPYDFNIKYGADSANAYLVGEWNTGRTEKIFKYVFKADEEEEDEDEGEPSSIEIIRYSNSHFYLLQDLFALGYKNKIDLSRLTIEYIANPNDYPLDNLKASRIYNLVRTADGLGVYTDMVYSESSKVENTSGTYLIEANHHSTLSIYTSPIVNVDGVGPIVVKRPSDIADTMLPVENSYLKLPNSPTDFPYASLGSNDLFSEGLYRHIVVTLGEAAAQGRNEYTGGFIRLESSRTDIPLQINILNFMRNIDEGGIKIYGSHNGVSESGPTEEDLIAAIDDDDDIPAELTSVIMGLFEDSNGVVDHTSVKLYVYVKYEAPSDDQSEFEPAILQIPTGFKASEGMRFDMTGLMELTPTADPTALANPDYYKIWEITLSLDQETATDGTKPGNVVVYNQSGSSDVVSRISAALDTTVMTGMKSIIKTEDGFRSIEFEFDSAATITKYIYLNITTHAAFEGYNGIKYDYSKLALTLESEFNGIAISTEPIRNGDAYVPIQITPSQLDKELNGDAIYLKFVDNTNGISKEIPDVRVLLTTRTVVYDIDLEEAEYSVVTNGKDGVYQETPITVLYNHGGVPPSSTDGVAVKIAVQKEDGTFSFVESASIDYNIDIKKEELQGSGEKKTYKYTLRVKDSMLSSDSTQYYVYAYYESDESIFAYAPIRITTTALDIALSDTVTDNIAGSVATLNFKTTEQTYDLSAKIINKGTSVDNDGSHTITYALFSDSDRRNPLGEGIASIENGIFKLLQPREASGTIYYRASFEDSESGKTRTLDLTINYTTSISKVSLTGIDEHTYTENESPDYAGTITLYYVSATAYTKLDLAGHISVLTAFDIAPTDYTVRFTADNGNLINGAIFGGSSKVIIPLSAGSTPLTITVTDDTETVVSIKVLLNIVELQSATLGESQGRIELFRNEQKSVTASLADDYSVFKPSFDISGDSRIIASKSDGSNSATFTLSLDRNKFKSDTDSDDTPYYLTVTMTYLYKDELSMSADIVGSLATTVTYTLTVYKDFGKLDFNLYENDSLVAANSSININSSATYKLKFDVPQDSWFVDGDWTFTAESLQTNVATLLNGGVFVSGAVTVLPSTTGAGAVTFNFTARGYGAVLTCSKSYTFTVPGNVSVTITPKINGVSQSALTFGDQETSKTIEIDFDGENAAEFTYSVTVTGAGTASSGCEIDFVGDATADSVSHADGTDVYTRTFKVTRPTTLILSSAVKLNGVTFYSKKYTLVLTATAPDFTVKSASDAEKVNPAETLKLSVENSAEKFKGEYTVSYSIVQSETGVTLGSPDGHDNWAVTLTAPEKNVKDKLVTVRAKVDVTSGAYKLTTYYVDKTITVVGIPLPTIDWKNGITVLGPSAVTAPGKMIDLSTYVNFNSQVNDSYGESYTYTGEIYAYSVSSTSLTSGFDYTLTSDGKLNILQSNNTKKGGKITIEVTATLGAGANKGSTVSATLVVVIMPELTTSAPKFVSGKPGTYTLGTLAYPANSTENGTDYSVKYSLVNSGDGAYFTLFGDRITVEQPVKEVKTVPVKVDIVITSGEYAGTAFTTNIDVTVLGTKLNESGSATISWTAGEDSNEYSYVTASSLVDMNTLTGWSISTISVSTDSTSFTRFRNNGQIEAAFSVNKDFNIRAVGSSDAATLTVYYDIVLTGTASESPVHCYGEGTITVEAISPELTVEIDGVNNSEIQPSVSIPGGQSFIVNYTEKHGLTLSGIDISDLGSALSYTVSGSSIQFTASSVALDQPMNVVTVTLKYNGKNSEVTVDKKINITVTATVLSAFDVTNTSIEVLYLNSGSSNTYYNVYSVWTASATNDSKHPVQLDIRSSTYLYNLFDNSNSASSKITVYMFDNQGVMQGSKEYQTSRLANNVTSITLDLSETAASEIQRLVLVMQFKRTMSTSATLTVNYYTTSDGGRSTDNYTQKSYTIRRISNGTVPVTFDANGGTIAGRPTTTVSGNAGATLHAPAADPVREGYRFEGWYPFTNPNATVDSDIIENTDFSVLRANDTFTIVFNTTYYAAWSIVPTTVTLDPDGGQISGVMGTKEIQVHFGEAYGGQLPTASAMSKTGYTFAGWYLEENLEAPVRITSSTIVTKSTAHTLKAHWTPKTYRVTLVDSHGKAEITSITVTFGGDFTGLPEGLTDTGYTFKGWYDKPNPEESDNAVTSSTQINSELLDNYALYAVWEAVKFNVSFNRNGGDGSSDPSPKTGVEYGSVYGELPTVSRAGYTFDGWTKTINGSDYIYAWSKVTETAGFTLYAHWTANTVTVSFDRNGGDGEADPISKTVERGSVYGQLPTVTRTGYEFKGWTKTLDSDDFVNAWDTVDSEITLHASWTAKEYTVTLVNIYGNPAVTFIKVKFNEKFTTLSDPAAVTGYEFKGWYDNANYGGTAVTNQTDVTDLADGYTLYAKWEAKKITVNFVTNDGVGTAQAKDVYYGGTYGTLPTLTKEGHTFDGWTKTNGGIDFVYDSSKVEETADTVTLYAKFTPKTYTVILVDSHGKAQVTSVTVTFGGSFDGLPEELEDDGYTFDGWYTSLEEGGQKVDGETPVTNLDEGYTLYAKWTANSPEEAGGADNQSDPQS